jgi:UDP-N-acetyl-2-amino-2-deoxyglucuronate dehydrogenase
VVIVATNTATHAALTIAAAEAGVRGVYCEKPMATNLADGQAMVAACRRSGTALAVNHQRRTLPVFLAMRRLIEQGVIGQVELIRGSCAGDLLSDGTHLVDTIRHLAGDAAVVWVFGQVYRAPVNPDEPRSDGFNVSGGWRYGHPVETGSLALLEFATGLRAEIHTGTMQIKGRGYQDYEVFGSAGRLHRAADWANPPLLIQTDASAGWRPVPVELHDADETKLWTYRQFARMVHEGADHPLAGESALADLELVLAIYESARRRDKIELPLQQPRFPLELLIERGEI